MRQLRTRRAGWLACLIVADEDAEDIDGVAMFCPECAAREFGGP
jgi:hypothetical protein